MQSKSQGAGFEGRPLGPSQRQLDAGDSGGGWWSSSSWTASYHLSYARVWRREEWQELHHGVRGPHAAGHKASPVVAMSGVSSSDHPSARNAGNGRCWGRQDGRAAEHERCAWESEWRDSRGVPWRTTAACESRQHGSGGWRAEESHSASAEEPATSGSGSAWWCSSRGRASWQRAGSDWAARSTDGHNRGTCSSSAGDNAPAMVWRASRWCSADSLGSAVREDGQPGGFVALGGSSQRSRSAWGSRRRGEREPGRLRARSGGPDGGGASRADGDFRGECHRKDGPCRSPEEGATARARPTAPASKAKAPWQLRGSPCSASEPLTCTGAPAAGGASDGALLKLLDILDVVVRASGKRDEALVTAVRAATAGRPPWGKGAGRQRHVSEPPKSEDGGRRQKRHNKDERPAGPHSLRDSDGSRRSPRCNRVWRREAESDEEAAQPQRCAPQKFSIASDASSSAPTRSSIGSDTSRSACSFGGSVGSSVATELALVGLSGNAGEEPPLPPTSESWDWPLSRPETKARLAMIDRQLLTSHWEELLGELQRVHRSRYCASDGSQ